jgi:CheY-like chemotaxis protein
MITLQRAGYGVTLVRSAHEIPQHVARQIFDALVCDLDTSSSQRRQLLLALRTIPCTTPIVVLLSPENHQQKALEKFQSCRVVSKPITRAALLAGIQSVLQPLPGSRP